MRRRLLAGTALSVLIGIVVSFVLAGILSLNLRMDEVQHQLDTALSLMTMDEERAKADPENFAEECKERLAEQGLSFRVTVLSLDGTVLGDSDENASNMGNHASRPEIKAAMSGEKGYDIRESTVGAGSNCYAAIQSGGQIYRAAVPVTSVMQSEYWLWLCALAGLIVGAIVAVIAATVLSRKATRPILELTHAAKHIADGDYHSRVGRYEGEVGELAESFNKMAQGLENTVKELQQNQGQLEGVLQGMDDGVIAVDENRRVLLCNGRAEELLEGKNRLNRIIPGGSLIFSQLWETLHAALDQGKPQRTTLAVGAHQERTLQVYAAPIDIGQKKKAALAVLADVTHVKRLEQMRSEFVANVTHELKTPLTSIRGYIELLRSGKRDEQTCQYFYDIIDIEAERLHSLIEDLLELSEIENARDDERGITCDAALELQKTLERLRPLALSAEVDMKANIVESLPMRANPHRLQQLYTNLIDNAIKYNHPGGRVEVTLTQERGMMLLSVKDTGIGIAKEHHERLFERFYRVDKGRSREIGGTGLGLSIVKHIVSLYGGDISLQSEPGKGSEFTVRIAL